MWPDRPTTRSFGRPSDRPSSCSVSTVRAASGAPVRGATVELRRGRQGLTVTTGPDGTASFSWTAPVFETSEFGGDSVAELRRNRDAFVASLG